MGSDGVDVRDVRPAGRKAAVSSDPRAARTRAKLFAAFDEVVADTAPADMSVAALTRAAGVNRTSFYEHFASPEELALAALSDLFDVVGREDVLRRRDHEVSGEEASRRALGEIVDFVWARRATYARLIGPFAPAGLAGQVTDSLARSGVASLAQLPGRPAAADPLVTAQYLAGGVLNVLAHWLSADDPVPRERIVDHLVAVLPGWLVADGTS